VNRRTGPGGKPITLVEFCPKPAARTKSAFMHSRPWWRRCWAIPSTVRARAPRALCSTPLRSPCRRVGKPPIAATAPLPTDFLTLGFADPTPSSEEPKPCPPTSSISRALAAIEESFIASAGPGGQNVNKVATAVQIRLDIFALRLSPKFFIG